MNWHQVNSGPAWIKLLHHVENQYGFPHDLLAAIAFVESSFDEGVIRGLVPSSDGLSLGLMQLEKEFYSSVRVPAPFTDFNVYSQIIDAATTMETNHSVLHTWPLAIAAYNAGLTAVQDGFLDQVYVAKVLKYAPEADQ
jgi:soluble lytic murein transglycosylase-like protein